MQKSPLYIYNRGLFIQAPPTVTDPAPCSDAEQRNKELDEVSTAIPGGAAAWNVANQRRGFFASAELALLCLTLLDSSEVDLISYNNDLKIISELLYALLGGLEFYSCYSQNGYDQQLWPDGYLLYVLSQ